MSDLALLLTLPLVLALIIWPIPRRWWRGVAVAGFLAAIVLALLAARLDLQPTAPAISFFGNGGGLRLGGDGILTEGMRQAIVLLYTGAAVIFLASARWFQGPNFVPAGLASLSAFLFALLVNQLAFGAAAILVAIGLLATMTADEKGGASLTTWRFFVLSAFALPLLLLAGWMLASQQLALGGAAWRLLLLGAMALLAGFPFHIWVRRIVAESPALTALFIVGPAQLVILTFLWRWLVQHGDFLSSTPLTAVLGWSGAVTVLIGGVQSTKAQNPRELLGALVLVDMGAVIICLSVAGIAQAGALILFRVLSLLAAKTALQWLDAGVVRDEGAETPAPNYRPLALALFAYGALSLIGAPLTPGFAARWAAVNVGSGGSLWWGFLQLLAVAGGVAGLARILVAIAADPDRQQRPVWSFATAQHRLQALALAVGLVLALALAIYPWPLLRFLSTISAQF